MKRDPFDVISRHCADLQIPVEWADLGPVRRGQCQVGLGVVVLNHSLTLMQATATLAHEVGHWEFGDVRSTAPAERRAWRYGASLVIDPGEYRRAEEVVGCHPNALALELLVTPRLILAWREWAQGQTGRLATTLAVKWPVSRSDATD